MKTKTSTYHDEALFGRGKAFPHGTIGKDANGGFDGPPPTRGVVHQHVQRILWTVPANQLIILYIDRSIVSQLVSIQFMYVRTSSKYALSNTRLLGTQPFGPSIPEFCVVMIDF
jgi:hypothetical protein